MSSLRGHFTLCRGFHGTLTLPATFMSSVNPSSNSKRGHFAGEAPAPEHVQVAGLDPEASSPRAPAQRWNCGSGPGALMGLFHARLQRASPCHRAVEGRAWRQKPGGNG